MAGAILEASAKRLRLLQMGGIRGQPQRKYRERVVVPAYAEIVRDLCGAEQR